LEINVVTVFLLALATALATGIGAVPFLLFGSIPRSWLGVASAGAAGFMLAASVALVRQGIGYGIARVFIGALAGLVLISFIRRRLGHSERDQALGALRGADAATGFVMVAVMTAHSFAEGLGIGVSFGGGEALGLLITVAIAVHNIPEGLAISLVLVPRGARVSAAAGWSVFSSLPQPLVAVPAFLFVESFTEALPVGLGFAAGAMIWMVFAELLPAARTDTSVLRVGVATALSFAVMTALQAILLGL
jgi:zinc transporter, ZIP family